MINRRDFIKKSSIGLAATLIAPTIVPSSVFGKEAPSNRITVACIGCGRQMVKPNIPQLLESPHAQIVAACDVDTWRLNNAVEQVNKFYSEAKGQTFKGCTPYTDYRKLLQDKSIDAVMISSPDHWHVPMAIDSIRAGKHVSLEKPISTCVEHGRKLVDAVKNSSIITRNDSDYRTHANSWKIIEKVRNGRIGKLKRIYVSVPPELNGDALPPQSTMPVPPELDYDFWLGPAWEAPYTENRVHSIKKYSRPGWMRVSDYCNGMVTNWGAHLMGLAQWGNNTEYTGPVEIEGTGTFDKGLWNTLNQFAIRYKFKNGVEVFFTIEKPSVRFEGTDGWIEFDKKLIASSQDIIDAPLGANETSFEVKHNDKDDFLIAIKENKQSLEPLETGHRTISMCQLGLIAIHTGSVVHWDPDKEVVTNDNAASAMLDIPIREKYFKF